MVATWYSRICNDFRDHVPYNTIHNEYNEYGDVLMSCTLRMCFGRGKNSFSQECHICVAVNDRRFAWASCNSPQQQFRLCAHAVKIGGCCYVIGVLFWHNQCLAHPPHLPVWVACGDVVTWGRDKTTTSYTWLFCHYIWRKENLLLSAMSLLYLFLFCSRVSIDSCMANVIFSNISLNIMISWYRYQ